MSQAAQVISLVAGLKGQPILNERITTTVITPGMLLREDSGTIMAHGVVSFNAQPLFAQTNKITASDIDTDYVIGELVSYGAYHSGQEVNALVAAGASAIVDGSSLESAGDGTVQVLIVSASTNQGARDSIVAYALESVDNSGGGTLARIKVRVA